MKNKMKESEKYAWWFEKNNMEVKKNYYKK